MKTDIRRDYFGFIDATNKVVIPLKYDYAGSFKDGLAMVGKGQYIYTTFGFIDKTGEFVFPIKYSYISELGNDYILITVQINDEVTRYGILRTSSTNSRPTPAETPSKDMARVTTSKVLVDGKVRSFEAYTISGSNYLKLRDVAMVLNGTSKQFEVIWDAKANAVRLITNKPYTPMGGELVMPNNLRDSIDQVTNSKILLNGKEIVLEAYVTSGNNYFKLRDLGEKLDFRVDYDSVTGNITIESQKGYAK